MKPAILFTLVACAFPTFKHASTPQYTTIGNEDKPVMATYGSIEPFNGMKEEWEQYMERTEQFFLANDLGNN